MCGTINFLLDGKSPFPGECEVNEVGVCLKCCHWACCIAIIMHFILLLEEISFLVINDTAIDRYK